MPSVHWRIPQASPPKAPKATPILPPATLDQLLDKITATKKTLARYEKASATLSCDLACQCYETARLLEKIRRLKKRSLKNGKDKELKLRIACLELTADTEVRWAEVLRQKLVALAKETRKAAEEIQQAIESLEKYPKMVEAPLST
jgi:hypothetical protein